ncbi:hypothetical protein HGRIS_010992 [Hohenbuehelia grisea]|uniref:Uncharacterized protein n=1 Tax=Hohenbuehelia grisea TaxID=104357 RepID=A0ABR3IYL8_9AGAR
MVAHLESNNVPVAVARPPSSRMVNTLPRKSAVTSTCQDIPQGASSFADQEKVEDVPYGIRAFEAPRKGAASMDVYKRVQDELAVVLLRRRSALTSSEVTSMSVRGSSALNVPIKTKTLLCNVLKAFRATEAERCRGVLEASSGYTPVQQLAEHPSRHSSSPSPPAARTCASIQAVAMDLEPEVHVLPRAAFLFAKPTPMPARPRQTTQRKPSLASQGSRREHSSIRTQDHSMDLFAGATARPSKTSSFVLRGRTNLPAFSTVPPSMPIPRSPLAPRSTNVPPGGSRLGYKIQLTKPNGRGFKAVDQQGRRMGALGRLPAAKAAASQSSRAKTPTPTSRTPSLSASLSVPRSFARKAAQCNAKSMAPRGSRAVWRG